MATIGTVEITGDIDTATAKRISRLLMTPVGSIPFDRNFGVDMSGLDSVPAITEGALLVEYIKKIRAYFPEYFVSKLTFSFEGVTITPKVVISKNG